MGLAWYLDAETGYMNLLDFYTGTLLILCEFVVHWAQERMSKDQRACLRRLYQCRQPSFALSYILCNENSDHHISNVSESVR